jgi:uncharacterized protein (TIGR03790 family)
MNPVIRLAPLFLLFTVPSRSVFAQKPENVLLVVNEASPISLEVGQYYAEKRGIAKDNVLHINTSTKESINRPEYEGQIQGPVASWLVRNSAHDRILYIVLTKGVPLRINGTSGQKGTVASVDSELTLLYRKLTGQSVPAAGPVGNPYFLGETPVAQAKPFSHEAQDIYLVCRLDGYTFADIRGLIDRGITPSREGKILLDEKDALIDKGNAWLKIAADRLRAAGFEDRVVLESSGKVLQDINGVLGYYSHGSNDPAIKVRDFNFGFVPGALAGMFVSTDARTFAEPPANWKIGTWQDKSTHYAGSPQSLAGDLIRGGVTGVAGHVDEPYLEATIRPDILFPAYLAGFNLAESFYLAMPYLSWQSTVVGDPLCAPFRQKTLAPAEIDKGIDPETELPGYFSIRRVRVAAVESFQKMHILPEVTKLMLKSEVRLAKADFEGARLVLEEATARDARLGTAQTVLASLYEQSGEYEKAIDRYRRALDSQPNNARALNNLAFALAVRRNSPAEALPLAEKAYTLLKGNPGVADTLGWIHHLLGDDEKAGKLLAEAVQGSPGNSEISLHVAIVLAAKGEMQAAADELARAVKLDARLEDRQEVKDLRAKLQKLPHTESRPR